MSREHDRREVSCSVRRCPRGCVCLSIGDAALHLTPDDFVGLLGLLQRAGERLGLVRPLPPGDRRLLH